MDEAKRKHLENKGWKVGEVAEFLELSPEDMALIEIKLALSRHLKERQQKLMTQAELTENIPQISQAENGDVSLSIELLIREMLATGVTPQEIGQLIAQIN